MLLLRTQLVEHEEQQIIFICAHIILSYLKNQRQTKFDRKPQIGN